MRQKRSPDSISQPSDANYKKQKSSTPVVIGPCWPDVEATESLLGNKRPLGSPKEVIRDLDDKLDSAHSNSTGAFPHQKSHPIHPRIKLPHMKGGSKALNFLAVNNLPAGFSHSAHELQSSKQPSNNRPLKCDSLLLPRLPPILDESLLAVPFTHPGVLQNVSSSTKFHLSYDRLEFLGDAYIELIATRMVYRLYPDLPAGRLSQQREMLIKNETLAEYSRAYGFDLKVKVPSAMRNQGSKAWTKTLGDVFEAYVAAVILSDQEHGFEVTEAWLTSLWQSKLSSQNLGQTSPPDTETRGRLNAKIMGKGIKVNYKDEAPPDEIRKEGKVVFHVGVYLTGWGWEDTYLGSGKGLSKKAAAADAAVQALANPLTEQVANVKREFDAKVSLERSIECKTNVGKGHAYTSRPTC